MADKNFVDGAIDPIASMPSGYKGSGSHTYDGEDTGAFGEYKRTGSPNGVPEVSYDGNIPDVSGEGPGKDGQH